MSRATKMTAVAFAAAMLAASPLALAQAPNPATASAPGATVTETRIAPGQMRATDLKGTNVYDEQKQKVGSIKDIVFDRGDGRVATVVLDVDGKYVAVGMNNLHFAMNDSNKIQQITIDRTRDDLKSAEAFHLDTVAPSSGSTIPPNSDNK